MSRAYTGDGSSFASSQAVFLLPFSWLSSHRRDVLRLRDRVIPWELRLFYYRHETSTRLGARMSIGLILGYFLTMELHALTDLLGLSLNVPLDVLQVGVILTSRCKFSARRVALPHGARLYREHESASDILLLVEGYGRLYVTHESNSQLTVGLVAPGDLFGEEAFIALPERESSFQAVLESQIDIIPRESFMKCLNEQTSLLQTVTEHLAQRVLQQRRQIERLTYGLVEQRLAWLLLELAAASSHTEDFHPILFLSHKDLATLLGVWRETVSAILTRWNHEGIISQRPGRLLLQDLDHLRAIAEEPMHQRA